MRQPVAALASAWLLGPLRRSGGAGRRAVAQPVNNPHQTARPLPAYPVDTGSPTHIWPSGAQGRLRPITRREWRQTPPDPSGCARSPNTGGPVIGGRWIPDTPDRLVMGERPRRLAPPCSAIRNGATDCTLGRCEPRFHGFSELAGGFPARALPPHRSERGSRPRDAGAGTSVLACRGRPARGLLESLGRTLGGRCPALSVDHYGRWSGVADLAWDVGCWLIGHHAVYAISDTARSVQGRQQRKCVTPAPPSRSLPGGTDPAAGNRCFAPSDVPLSAIPRAG